MLYDLNTYNYACQLFLKKVREKNFKCFFLLLISKLLEQKTEDIFL